MLLVVASLRKAESDLVAFASVALTIGNVSGGKLSFPPDSLNPAKGLKYAHDGHDIKLIAA